MLASHMPRLSPITWIARRARAHTCRPRAVDYPHHWSRVAHDPGLHATPVLRDAVCAVAAKSNELGGSELTFRTEPRNGATWVALKGNITEQVDFAALKALPPPLVIDLGAVDRINSLGVRAWIYFVKDREGAGAPIRFERVSPQMVTQMTMITNFMGRSSQVASVLVPYVCLKDNTEQLDQLDIEAGAQLHEIACPKCGARMEIDDLEATYTRLL
jgi:anti-anti-sigma regulatory factor